MSLDKLKGLYAQLRMYYGQMAELHKKVYNLSDPNMVSFIEYKLQLNSHKVPIGKMVDRIYNKLKGLISETVRKVHEEEKRVLASNVIFVNEESPDHKDKISRMENEKNEILEKNKIYSSDVLRMQTEKQNLVHDLHRMQTENEKLINEMKTLKQNLIHDLHRMQTENDELINEMKTEIDNISQDKQTLTDEINDLEKEKEDLSNLREEDIGKKLEIEKKLDEVNKLLNESRNELTDRKNSDKDKNTMSMRIDTLEKEKQGLTDMMNDFIETENRVHAEKKSIEIQLHDVNAQLQVSKKELDEKKIMLNELTRSTGIKNAEKLQELHEVNKLLDASKNELSQKNIMLDELDNKNIQLNTLYESQSKEKAGLLEETETMTQDIEALAEDLSDKQSMLDELTKKLAKRKDARKMQFSKRSLTGPRKSREIMRQKMITQKVNRHIEDLVKSHANIKLKREEEKDNGIKDDISDTEHHDNNNEQSGYSPLVVDRADPRDVSNQYLIQHLRTSIDTELLSNKNKITDDEFKALISVRESFIDLLSNQKNNPVLNDVLKHLINMIPFFGNRLNVNNTEFAGDFCVKNENSEYTQKIYKLFEKRLTINEKNEFIFLKVKRRFIERFGITQFNAFMEYHKPPSATTLEKIKVITDEEEKRINDPGRQKREELIYKINKLNGTRKNKSHLNTGKLKKELQNLENKLDKLPDWYDDWN